MPVRTQLIFIPGVTDTDLYANPAAPVPRRLWYGDVPTAFKGLPYLRLAADGETPDPLAGLTVDRIYSATSMVSYSPMYPLMTAMQSLGWTTRFFGYDWRKHVSLGAVNFRSWLRTSGALNNTFYVVAHSMGGLVARLAFQLLTSSEQAQWIRTVYLCTPFGGSYDAIAALADLEGTAAQEYPLYGQVMPKATVVQPAIRGFVKLTLAAMNSISASWPGLFELLPNTLNAKDWQGADTALSVYDASHWVDFNSNVTQQNLRNALGYQGILAAYATQLHPLETTVIGTELSTRIGLAGGSAANAALDQFTYGNGDGIVPWVNQQIPAANPRLIDLEKMHHRQAPSDPRVLAGLDEWLLGSDTFPVTEPATLNLVGNVPAARAGNPNPGPANSTWPGPISNPFPFLQAVGDP